MKASTSQDNFRNHSYFCDHYEIMQRNVYGGDIWKGYLMWQQKQAVSIFILTKMTYFALFLGFPSACHILTLDIWMTNSSHILFHQMSLSLFLKIHFFLLCVSVFVPNVCICSRCILGVFKVHKRLLDLLEVEI